MKETLLNGEGYLQDYLPWANNLMNSEPSLHLIGQVQADRYAIVGSTVLFQPQLERLTAELELSKTQQTEEETVNILADFEASQLRTIAISSAKRYFVLLDLKSDQWPVRYGDDHSRKLDQLVKKEYLRERAEEAVVRSSAALFKHVAHRVPVGDVPEVSLDWPIEESDMRFSTLKALKEQGITTYGDLGILSINQLLKFKGLGKGGIEDIKIEFQRLGWLSGGHKKT